jgi:hypothetical protein
MRMVILADSAYLESSDGHRLDVCPPRDGADWYPSPRVAKKQARTPC